MRRQIFRMCVGAFIIQSSLHSDCTCNDDYYKQWVGFGHSEGRGIGYHDGYTTFSTFLAAQKDFFCFCPIMDLRWHVFNRGKSAGNFGLGGRTFLNKYDAIAGVNLFYDFRQTKPKTFHQMGIGLEWLGVCWDISVNGYIPMGHMRSHFYDKILKEECDPTFHGFSGNNILIGPSILKTSRKREFDFGGFDAEVRRTIFDNGTVRFEAGIGPYFYFGDYRRNVYGGMSEIAANVLDYVIVSGRLNYDSVFHTTANAQLTVQIPFGCASVGKRHACTPCELLERKLVRHIRRNEIIPTKTEHERFTIVSPVNSIALDRFGKPIFLQFVNNTNPDPGIGTFEDPFNSFTVAESETFDGDIVYVLPGNGTSSGMDTGFTLKDNQQLIGSGAPFTLESLCGSITIPAQSFPIVTNLGGDGFTLANNNLISGFDIVTPIGRAIFGSGIMDAVITNNIVTNPGSNTGIYILNSDGLLTITNNIVSSNIVANFPPGFPDLNPIDSGIFIQGDGNFADVTISNNTTTNFSAGIRVFADNDSMMSSTVTGNTVITARDIGIDLDSFNGGNNTNIVTNNTVNQATNYGILVFAGITSDMTAEISGNQVSNAGMNGIVAATGNGGQLRVNVSDNLLVNNNFLAETGNTPPPNQDVLCLKLTGNNSNLGYQLINNNGPTTTFNLEPLTPPNIGPITETGDITPVPAGFCGEPAALDDFDFEFDEF